MMFSARTIIGIVIGAAIIGISSTSWIMDMSQGPLVISEEYGLGESTTYSITGDEGSAHSMTIRAEKFQLEMESPGDGFAIPRTEFANSHSIDWTHQETGRTLIYVQNTGGNTMSIDATLEVSSDPIWLAYRLVVITTGVIIIGFSLGFSFKKPRGF